MYIDITEVWFEITNGQIPSIFDHLSASHTLFSFPDDNLGKCQWIFTKLGMFIDIVKLWFGIANGHVLLIFDKSYLPATCPYFRFWTIT